MRDQVKYGDKITVTLSREGLADTTISGTVEEDQPGTYSVAGWLLTDDRVTITAHTPQWLEPPDWQTWEGLAFDGKRYIRVARALPVVVKPLALPVPLSTVWRAVDEDATLSDAELLALMKGRRVIRLVLSEVWS